MKVYLLAGAGVAGLLREQVLQVAELRLIQQLGNLMKTNARQTRKSWQAVIGTGSAIMTHSAEHGEALDVLQDALVRAGQSRCTTCKHKHKQQHNNGVNK